MEGVFDVRRPVVSAEDLLAVCFVLGEQKLRFVAGDEEVFSETDVIALQC